MSNGENPPEELAREAARGRSGRTPMLAFGGVIGTVALAFLVFVVVALAIYFLL